MFWALCRVAKLLFFIIDVIWLIAAVSVIVRIVQDQRTISVHPYGTTRVFSDVIFELVAHYCRCRFATHNDAAAKISLVAADGVASDCGRGVVNHIDAAAKISLVVADGVAFDCGRGVAEYEDTAARLCLVAADGVAFDCGRGVVYYEDTTASRPGCVASDDVV